MTDLEITEACAMAMGISVRPCEMESCQKLVVYDGDIQSVHYRPLHDDAQAMALVKKCDLNIDRHSYDNKWFVYLMNDRDAGDAYNENLNRAICECAAKMQREKASA